MKSLSIATLILIIVGALTRGPVGAFDVALVSAVFGLTPLVQILVGRAAIHGFVLLKPPMDRDPTRRMT